MPLSTLRQGARGTEVEALQKGLNFHLPFELPPLKEDQIFGPKTLARLKTFQKRHGLAIDGVAGKKTLPALYSFVNHSHHILPFAHKQLNARRLSIRGGPQDIPPSLGLILPTPRLQVPFLKNAIPPFLTLPLLKLDPDLMKWVRSRPFEITAGTNMVFRKVDPGVDAFVEVTANVWSAPLFKDKLGLSLSPGVVGEVNIPNGKPQFSVFYSAQAELHDVLTYRGIDILNLQAQAKLQAKPGSSEPPDLSATLKAGPTVESKQFGVTFGIGGYLEYKTNGIQHELQPGVFLEGVYRF